MADNKLVELKMVDVNGAKIVEVEVSEGGKTVWVNVDGVCRLRAVDSETIKFEWRKAA